MYLAKLLGIFVPQCFSTSNLIWSFNYMIRASLISISLRHSLSGIQKPGIFDFCLGSRRFRDQKIVQTSVHCCSLYDDLQILFGISSPTASASVGHNNILRPVCRSSDHFTESFHTWQNYFSSYSLNQFECISFLQGLWTLIDFYYKLVNAISQDCLPNEYLMSFFSMLISVFFFSNL